MNFITERGYAKINLYLDITSKYEDGYHQVNTVMQTVSLSDDVALSLNDSGKIELTCDNADIPLDEGNIAYRAAELFFKRSSVRSGVNIAITKRIPVSAGLGGGSADAAAVLRGLNELFDRPFSKDKISELGAELGADVPFCIVGGTVVADGRGDHLSHVAPMRGCYIVLANGGEGISTPFAYRQLDNKYHNFENGAHRTHTHTSLVEALERGSVAALSSELYNVFEKAILPIRPVAQEIRNTLTEMSAKGILMSGSGPTVFGIFDDEKLAESAAAKIKAKGYFSSVCHPIGKIY